MSLVMDKQKKSERKKWMLSERKQNVALILQNIIVNKVLFQRAIQYISEPVDELCCDPVRKRKIKGNRVDNLF